MAQRAELRARLEGVWQERHNLIVARITPPDPERQKREDEVMSGVMALWQQLAADEASLC